jgi:CubicO group peptidase (beta-lactamase class C family)
MRRGSQVAILAAMAAGLASFSFGAPAKDSDAPVVAGELGRRLDEAVQRTTAGGFWGVVLVARGGETLLAKGYGFADYGATPNTPRTLFEIASASKQFTAAAVLRLAQSGKLELTDPLSKFIPDAPPDKAGITLRMLLTHTAGFSPEAGVPYASPLGRPEYLRTILAVPLASAPGERFAYANAAYAVLAAVVEVVSGKSFEEFSRKELFEPAGLVDTGFISDPKLIRSGRAAVRLDKETPAGTAADWNWGWGYRGMGGVVTTVLDLARWDRALRGVKVLDRDSVAKLHAPEKEGYALGWMVGPTARGTTRAQHGGGVLGFGCWLVRYLGEDAFVAVLSNGRSDLGRLVAAIDRVLFPSPMVEAVVDIGARPQTEYLATTLSAGVRWEATRDGEVVVLRVLEGGDAPVTVRLPVGRVSALAASLAAAIEARRRDDPGGPAATEAGIYFSAYGPGTKRVELAEGLEVRVLPLYQGQDQDGRPVEDRRVVVLLDDTARGQWPFMAKLNVAAAADLRAKLEAAAK